MLGIIIIPVKVEESWWASQRKWHWSKPLKDGEEVDKWYCGEPACRLEKQHKQRHVEVGTHTLGGSDWLGPEVVEENRRG